MWNRLFSAAEASHCIAPWEWFALTRSVLRKGLNCLNWQLISRNHRNLSIYFNKIILLFCLLEARGTFSECFETWNLIKKKCCWSKRLLWNWTMCFFFLFHHLESCKEDSFPDFSSQSLALLFNFNNDSLKQENFKTMVFED